MRDSEGEMLYERSDQWTLQHAVTPTRICCGLPKPCGKGSGIQVLRSSIPAPLRRSRRAAFRVLGTSIYILSTAMTPTPAPLASFTRMWANLLGWRGVRETDTIVFYGEFTDMCAARGYWFTEYLGHTDVHVLDGGIAAWSAAGLTVGTEGDPPRPVKFAFTVAPERVATYSSVLDAMDDADCVIVDNRSREEFVGTDKRARHYGAIPGAKHRDWEDLYDHESGCMKAADQLREAFETLGATPNKEITLYCNTGYRSAHAFLGLRLLGYPRIRNYVGSWQEWGNRHGLPIWNPE